MIDQWALGVWCQEILAAVDAGELGRLVTQVSFGDAKFKRSVLRMVNGLCEAGLIEFAEHPYYGSKSKLTKKGEAVLEMMRLASQGEALEASQGEAHERGDHE